MNKAQHLLVLLAFLLALTDLVRTQKEDVRKKGDGFVQFNDEDNFLRQDGRKGQQQLGNLKQVLQQMLQKGITQPGKRADEDYDQDYEEPDDDYDNDADSEPDAGTETNLDNNIDDDDADSGNENETDNGPSSEGDAGSDSNNGSSPDPGTEADTGSDSNSGSNAGSNSGIDSDDDTFNDDDFVYNPYTNSFNEQYPDGTYVYGYAVPHGVRRYERAFYSDKYKGLVVEGFSTEPRQRGQRVVYELRCYRSDAYGYRPLKVQYLKRPPTVQRDVEPDVDCFN